MDDAEMFTRAKRKGISTTSSSAGAYSTPMPPPKKLIVEKIVQKKDVTEKSKKKPTEKEKKKEGKEVEGTTISMDPIELSIPADFLWSDSIDEDIMPVVNGCLCLLLATGYRPWMKINFWIRI